MTDDALSLFGNGAKKNHGHPPSWVQLWASLHLVVGEEKRFFDHVQSLDRLISEYQKACSQAVLEEVALSVLLRCLPQHIKLSLKSATKYSDVRSCILGFGRCEEVSEKCWCASQCGNSGAWQQGGHWCSWNPLSKWCAIRPTFWYSRPKAKLGFRQLTHCSGGLLSMGLATEQIQCNHWWDFLWDMIIVVSYVCSVKLWWVLLNLRQRVWQSGIVVYG